MEEEDLISLNDFLDGNNKDKDETTAYSNFSDVIREDYLKIDNLDNLENKEKYLYQPQFKDNSCEMKIVGYSDKGIKPMVKMNEFKFMNEEWLIISHLYNLDDINNLNSFSRTYIDIMSLVLNKENYDMKISIRYEIIKKELQIDKRLYEGKFGIFFSYKKSEIEEIKKIRDLDKFPGNKALEYLVKELTNPYIIDKYE